MASVETRILAPQDAPWAAGLMAERRELYATYSPVFWRPARGVTGLHARFLRHQIEAAGNVALRTGHGFIIAQARAGAGFVDDFAVDGAGTWRDDGAALLRAAWQRLAAAGAGTVRVVTAKADRAKAEMLAALSLRVADEWWVKPLTATGQAPAGMSQVTGTGFSGSLGPAPAVYDPGGPVLHAETVAGDADVAVLEREAAAMGAVLAVVPAPPGSDRSQRLDRRGWDVASQWYLGQPG
jgi:hypothetical protein